MVENSYSVSCPDPKRAISGVQHRVHIPLSSTFPLSSDKGRLPLQARPDKQRLFPGGGTEDNYHGNYGLLTSLLDSLEGRLSGEVSQQRKHV